MLQRGEPQSGFRKSAQGRSLREIFARFATTYPGKKKKEISLTFERSEAPVRQSLGDGGSPRASNSCSRINCYQPSTPPRPIILSPCPWPGPPSLPYMRVWRIIGGLLCIAISMPVGTIAYALVREMFENTPIQAPALYVNNY